MLARMLAIGRQHDAFTADLYRYLAPNIVTKTNENEATSLTIILYCILLL